MSKAALLTALLFIILQPLAVWLSLRPASSGNPGQPATAASRLLRFVLIEAVVLAAVVAGLVLENRKGVVGHIQGYLEPAPGPTPGIEGLHSDPGLLIPLRAQGDALPRPAMDDAGAVARWADTLRTRIRDDVLRVPAIDGPVTYRVLDSRTLEDDLQRRMIAFRSVDGSEIPGYLFRRAGTPPGPAVLVIPGHVRPDQSGLDQAAGLTGGYLNAAARDLAAAGFVTFVFELRGFGYLGAPFDTEHRLSAYNAVLAGDFYKAVVMRDVATAFRLLQEVPEVDPDRVGVTGASYGGELAVTFAGIEPHVRAVASHAFGGRLGPNQGARGARTKQPHYDHLIPGVNALMHVEDVFRLIAPRPALILRGEHEGFSDPGFAASLGQTWSISGAPGGADIRLIPDGRHEFFVEPTIAFFARHL